MAYQEHQVCFSGKAQKEAVQLSAFEVRLWAMSGVAGAEGQ
jgi:hypothetical protein